MRLKKPSGVQFNSEQLEAALRDVEDLMARCLLKFVVLGDVAKHILHDTYLTGNKLSIGAEKRYFTKEVITTLKEQGIKRKGNKFVYEYKGVPIEIVMITRKYPFFENPDYRMYAVGEYGLPNPFDQYWKVRGLIR